MSGMLQGREAGCWMIGQQRPEHAEQLASSKKRRLRKDNCSGNLTVRLALRTRCFVNNWCFWQANTSFMIYFYRFEAVNLMISTGAPLLPAKALRSANIEIIIIQPRLAKIWIFAGQSIRSQGENPSILECAFLTILSVLKWLQRTRLANNPKSHFLKQSHN